MELSYCIINTSKRELLLSCLASVYREHPAGIEYEVLVLDNASEDGSAEAVREQYPEVKLMIKERRAGASENNSDLLRAAQGELCMMLDEDSELLPGATRILIDELRASPEAAVTGAQLLHPGGRRVGCAWRLPGVGTSLLEAVGLERWVTAQLSRKTREVGWVQSATMLLRRRAAEEIGYLDPDFFLYFDEVDFQKRLRDAGWTVLHVPAAKSIHHQQLANDRTVGDRRVVEFHRMWDLYMQKHHSLAAARLVRVLVAWKYAMRALTAPLYPSRDFRRLALHSKQALRPYRGEGMSERAALQNARREHG